MEKACRDRGLGLVEKDGGSGVRGGVEGKKNGLRPMRKWTLARVG